MKHLLEAAVLLVACFATWRLIFWTREGKKLQKSGYIPPAPTIIGRVSYGLLCKFFARLLLGPIQVIGKENASGRGRTAILPNHQHIADFAVVRAALPYGYRQIGAAKEVKGIRAPFAAYFGTFAVPVMGGKSNQGHGAALAAIQACARVLIQRLAKLLMFPQGKLVFDNVLRAEDFRTGCMRALGLAAEEVGRENLFIQPMAINYWKPTGNESLLRRLYFRAWSKFGAAAGSKPRVGATVVLGKLIPFSDFPTNPHEAIQVYREHLQTLLDQAIEATPAQYR
ncbi:MAG TPA: hypothetical protein V6C72_09695 [Chroococcales cyanobacterium]